jgi:hypothetical protein
VRGLVLANDKLVVAGPPKLLDERKSIVAPDDPELVKAAEDNEAAWHGKKGGIMMIVNPADGSVLSQQNLPYAPTWDGLIVARGSIYMTTLDGQVVSLK